MIVICEGLLHSDYSDCRYGAHLIGDYHVIIQKADWGIYGIHKIFGSDFVGTMYPLQRSNYFLPTSHCHVVAPVPPSILLK